MPYLTKHLLTNNTSKRPQPIAIFHQIPTTDKTAIKPHLIEHFFQVVLGVDPGGNGVTEEDEVMHHASRVNADHGTHATECGVFLLVVTDVAQRRTPTVQHTCTST